MQSMVRVPYEELIGVKELIQVIIHGVEGITNITPEDFTQTIPRKWWWDKKVFDKQAFEAAVKTRYTSAYSRLDGTWGVLTTTNYDHLLGLNHLCKFNRDVYLTPGTARELSYIRGKSQ